MRIVGVALLVTCSLSWQSIAQDSPRLLNYAPAKVELNGTIRCEVRYGPPNYGEDPDSDTKEKIVLLLLDETIAVESNPVTETLRDSFSAVRTVEIIGKDKFELCKPLNRYVKIFGELEQALLRHYTDVTLTPDVITDIK